MADGERHTRRGEKFRSFSPLPGGGAKGRGISLFERPRSRFGAAGGGGGGSRVDTAIYERRGKIRARARANGREEVCSRERARRSNPPPKGAAGRNCPPAESTVAARRFAPGLPSRRSRRGMSVTWRRERLRVFRSRGGVAQFHIRPKYRAHIEPRVLYPFLAAVSLQFYPLSPPPLAHSPSPIYSV